MSKKKILVISNLYWNFYNFRYELICNLNSSHDITLLAKKDIYSSKFSRKGIKCFFWNINTNSTNPIYEFLTILSLFKIIFKLKPDSVLSFTPKANIYASLLSWIFNFHFYPNITGLGSYYINNGFIKKLFNFTYKFLFKKTKIIFVQNKYDKIIFNKQYRINNTKLSLLPGSGINTDQFKPKFIFNQKCKTFLVVARLIKEKGIYEYFEAVKMVKKKDPSLDFFLIGDFDEKNKNSISKKLYLELKNSRLIKYLGYQKDIIKYLHLFDCLILPSYREGTSRYLLEGISIGKPIIVSNVPGCRELCNQNNGYRFDINSIYSFYKCIIKMSQKNKDELMVMAKASRKLASDKYDINKVIEKYNYYLSC